MLKLPRMRLGSGLTLMLFCGACSQFPRTQTIVLIRTTEAIARMTQSLSVVVRDEASSEILNVPIATQRNFLERTVDFPGYPIRIPISSSQRGVNRSRFEVCVRAIGFAGAEITEECVQSGFVTGKVLAVDLWLLPAASCSPCADQTSCAPQDNAFACISTAPEALLEYENSDAAVGSRDARFESGTPDAAMISDAIVSDATVDARDAGEDF